jgi:hypothetical protein
MAALPVGLDLHAARWLECQGLEPASPGRNHVAGPRQASSLSCVYPARCPRPWRLFEQDGQDRTDRQDVFLMFFGLHPSPSGDLRVHPVLSIPRWGTFVSILFTHFPRGRCICASPAHSQGAERAAVTVASPNGTRCPHGSCQAGGRQQHGMALPASVPAALDRQASHLTSLVTRRGRDIKLATTARAARTTRTRAVASSPL